MRKSKLGSPFLLLGHFLQFSWVFDLVTKEQKTTKKAIWLVMPNIKFLFYFSSKKKPFEEFFSWKNGYENNGAQAKGDPEGKNTSVARPHTKWNKKKGEQILLLINFT